jgi:hypothetical protein
MDRSLLLRVARYAVEDQFTQRRHQPVELDTEPAGRLQRFLGRNGSLSGEVGETVHLQVNGRGGGQWHFRVCDGRVKGADLGLGPEGSAGFYLSADTFSALVSCRMSIEASIHAGRVIVQGSRTALPGLVRVLQQIISAA